MIPGNPFREVVMPRFVTLGREFRFNGNDYRGHVVASAEAFYFVIDPHGMTYGGGLLGAAFAAVKEHFNALGADTSYTRDLSQLPAAISGDPDWPVRQKQGTMLVVPREAVFKIRFPWLWLDNRVCISADRMEVSAVFNILRRGKIRRLLADVGWTMAN